MKIWWILIIVVLLSVPGAAQDGGASKSVNGYLVQTAATPESYLISNAQEFQSFVIFLPKVTPYKNLPAPPNPDPFLQGHAPNFEHELLVVATGRDRTADPPRLERVESGEDGTRIVRFVLPPRQAETYPYGWAVYTAITLPRIDGETKVEVIDLEKKEEDFPRGDFKRADFKRI
ncbi:MAG: hypothetical protein WC314_19020 [Vulcanimicrobiota bacterium]